MRSHLYFRKLIQKPKSEEQTANLEAQIKQYLENGGTITVIPEGVSGEKEDKRGRNDDDDY